ncbi:MAG: hypothetical protein VYA08_00310, partial [Pseudomonadota bacterium]|nr:hypothetical protein [Pseudomonadota bacterium]
LMAGLGREGFGYFALDVTDPSSPRFLFAFENDPENQKIRHWTANGFLTEQDYGGVAGAYNYQKLGEALSTPTIFMTSDRTFVAAIGGGLNNTDDKDYGSALYLIDLENQGKVFFRNDLADVSGGLNNSHPAQVTVVTADTTSAATYKGAMLYSADLQSKLTKINHNAMSGCNGCNRSVDIDMLWTEGDQFGNDALSFNPVSASIDSADTLWIYFGTGNLDRLQSSVATVQNRIFAKKDFNFPGAGSGGGVYWTSPGFKDVTLPGATCPADSDTGWYINLGRDEKVTNKIQIEDGVLFAPLYTPDTAQSCFPGTSTVAEFGYDCGKLVRRTVLGAGQITGVRIFKDKIYGGVSGIPDTGSDTEVELDNEFK